MNIIPHYPIPTSIFSQSPTVRLFIMSNYLAPACTLSYIIVLPMGTLYCPCLHIIPDYPAIRLYIIPLSLLSYVPCHQPILCVLLHHPAHYSDYFFASNLHIIILSAILYSHIILPPPAHDNSIHLHIFMPSVFPLSCPESAHNHAVRLQIIMASGCTLSYHPHTIYSAIVVLILGESRIPGDEYTKGLTS
jgi:hypothetical protein